LKGRLIGINTAIISPSGAYSGVGFAVPVNTVKQVVPQLIQHGKVIRPGLGVSVLPDNVAERLGIEGVMIAQVPEGSAAAAADLRGIERNWLGEAVAGDMIIAINGEKVSNSDDLAAVLEKYKIGDTVQVRVVRAGKEKEVRLPLQEIK
jgi:S1-C subfamily serine protease